MLLARFIGRKPSPCKEGLYPVLPASSLLDPHKERLGRIRKHLGLPEQHWTHYYLGLFTRYARFCQLIPASEAHHHSDPGGLLRHGLEAVEYALERRAGKLLPPGASPEELTRFQDAWTWGVTTAALLHDIGKPVTDLEIILDGADDQAWDPWEHATLTETGASCYAIRYRRGRRYRLHERLGLLLAERILPPGGLRWIASHPQLLAEWVGLLSGNPEEAPALADLVLAAEQRSVAEDLGSDAPRAVTGSRIRPLAERLATALRHLVDEEQLPINRDGAAAWVKRDSLWVVSKRGLDAIRDQMNREGQTGVPGRNDRLMDELQQHGWIIPQGDRAIWKARVFADGWPRAHELSFLRFPLDRLWPNPETRPEPFEGTVDPVEGEEEQAQQTPPDKTTTDDKQAPQEHSRDPDTSAHTDTEETVNEEPAPEPDTPEAPDTDAHDPEQALVQGTLDTVCTDPAPDHSDDANMDPSPTLPEESQDHPEEDLPSDAGQAFLEWLRTGLRTRKFQVNNANARIHRVPEGLLLVSPGIFKDFDREGWNKAQKRFQKLRINRKAPDGTNIWHYRVRSGGRIIKGFLVQDLEQVFPDIDLPSPNPHLELQDNQK